MKLFKRFLFVALACICGSFAFTGCKRKNIVKSYEYIEKNGFFSVELYIKEEYDKDLYCIPIQSPGQYIFYECEINNLNSLLNKERFIRSVHNSIAFAPLIKIEDKKYKASCNWGFLNPDTNLPGLSEPTTQIEFLVYDFRKEDVTGEELMNYIGYIKITEEEILSVRGE